VVGGGAHGFGVQVPKPPVLTPPAAMHSHSVAIVHWPSGMQHAVSLHTTLKKKKRPPSTPHWQNDVTVH